MFHQKEPTYWSSDPNKRPDVIDMFMQRDINQLHKDRGVSNDHTPIILTLSELVIIKSPLALTNKSTDWEGYSEYLENNCSQHSA